MSLQVNATASSGQSTLWSKALSLELQCVSLTDGVCLVLRKCMGACQKLAKQLVGSASYPIPLCDRMAAGSKLAHEGLWPDRAPAENMAGSTDVRSWHNDPDWVQELCEGVQYRELFRYKFKKSGHINTLECRVYKSWLKHCAKRHPRSRVVGLLDSRVPQGSS